MEKGITAATVATNETRQVSLVILVLILGALAAFNSMSTDMYLPAFPQIARELDKAGNNVSIIG